MNTSPTINDLKITPVALKELLAGAESCFTYIKLEPEWKVGGILGFPAAILLLCFIDAAGYLLTVKGTSDDNDDVEELKSSKNFKILTNKNYFDPALSNAQKNKLYKYYRGFLVHQASLSKGTAISYSAFNNNKSIIHRWDDGSDLWELDLAALYSACKKLFDQHFDDIVSKSD